jgi:hypothetical protein
MLAPDQNDPSIASEDYGALIFRLLEGKVPMTLVIPMSFPTSTALYIIPRSSLYVLVVPNYNVGVYLGCLPRFYAG